MADYRKIYVKIWADPDFQNYSAEGKLLFIYLCTNPLSSESGIYIISPRTISNDTAISLETVSKLLANRLPTDCKPLANSLKNVYYDPDNLCVFIANFRNYNPGGAPELIKKSIQKDFRSTFKAYGLWLEFLKRYPNFLNEICPLVNMLENSFQTVYKHINTNTYTNTNTNTGTNTNTSTNTGDKGGAGEKGNPEEKKPGKYIYENGGVKDVSNNNTFDLVEIYPENAGNAWDKVLESLVKVVSKSNYRTWLEKTKGLGIISSDFLIDVPNQFSADYLMENQKSLIEKTLVEVTGKPYSLNILIHTNGKNHQELENVSPVES